MLEDNVAWWVFGIVVGMWLMAMLMQPHKHVDDFVRDIDAYDKVNELLGKTVEKGRVSALAAGEAEQSACPITYWNYFWSNLLGRIQWWNTARKHRPETTLERLKREMDDEVV